YLEGYANNLLITRGSSPGNDQAILDNLARVSTTSATDIAQFEAKALPGIPNGLWLNEILHAALVQGFASAANTSEKTKYSELLLGFNQGAIRAAEVVYADAFLLAYGIGYADGFRDGYSKGYSEGYRA